MNGSASNESWLLIMTIVIADVIRINIRISNTLSYFLWLIWVILIFILR